MEHWQDPSEEGFPQKLTSSMLCAHLVVARSWCHEEGHCTPDCTVIQSSLVVGADELMIEIAPVAKILVSAIRSMEHYAQPLNAGKRAR
jgi:hypothetical protein